MALRILFDLGLMALGIFLAIRGHILYRRMARALHEARGGDPKQFRFETIGWTDSLGVLDDYSSVTGDRRTTTVMLLFSYGGAVLFVAAGMMLILMANAAGFLPVNHR